MAEERMLNDEILLGLIKANSGGGGTGDYDDLENRPKVNNITLTGNKSASDLGLADDTTVQGILDGQTIDSFGDVETALAGKQGTLTAGDYINLNNGNISVNRNLVVDNYLYTIGTNDAYYITVTKSQGGEVISTNTYSYSRGTVTNVDGNFTITHDYDPRLGYVWVYTSLKDSAEHTTGYTWTKAVTDTPFSVNEAFPSEDVSGYKLVIKSEMDSAIDAAVASAYHHAGTKTCAELVAGLLVAGNEGNVYNMTDSGTTTSDFIEGAGQPIKAGDNVGIAKISDGVYKFDLLSGFVDTTNFVQKSETAGLLKNDGTVDTTIQGDVNTLKSGLTTLDTEVNGDAVTYPYADVITIEDAIPANLADCNVKIEPVQDLHGYDKPWVGGANTNKVIYPYITTYPFVYGGVTVNDNKGRITITGNATNNFTTVLVGQSDSVFGNVANAVPLLNADGKYTISGGTIVARLKVRQYRDGSLLDEHICTGTPIVIDVLSTDLFEIGISIYANNAYNNTLSPQIEAGETASEWTPYSNICPITGHTEASVQRDGKNLAFKKISGYTINANGVIEALASYNIFVGRVKKGQTYTVTKSSDYEVYAFYTTEPSAGSTSYDGSRVALQEEADYYTIIAPIDGYIAFRANVGFDNGQLELGSTATPYVPYAGQTYTIALGDTIYGGTVDFDSGVMTVTHALVDMGDFTWSTPSAKGAVSSTTSISGAINPQSNYDKANMDCSNYLVLPYYVDGVSGHDANSTDGAFGIWVTDNNKMFVRDHNLAGLTAEQVKTALTGSTVLFSLATPTTIQLTPQQIQLLKGQNTLTASTGQISVTVNGVSGSIGSLTSDKQDKTDYALNTTAKTVVGGINEVDGKISNLLTRRNMTNTTQANGAFLIQTSGEYIIPIGFKVVEFPEGYGEVGGYIIRGVDGNYYIMLRDANGTPIANKSYTIQVVYVAQVNLS